MSLLRTILFVLSASFLAASVVAQHDGGEAAAPQAPPTPTYEGNQCVECHLSLEGTLRQAVVDWRESSHFKAGVACDGCHGGEPARREEPHDPATGFVGAPRLHDVPYFCGKCHAQIKEKHLGSPHGAQGLPNCVTCHGNHAIVTPDPTRIITEAACTKCHPFDAAQKALTALGDARRLVGDLDATVHEIEHIPQLKRQLDAMQHDLLLDRAGVVATFHSFRIGDIERIGANVGRVDKLLARLTERERQRRDNMAHEIPFIVGLTLFLLVAAGLGYARYHGQGEITPGK